MGKESDAGKTKTLRLIMLGGFFCFTCCAMVGSLLFGSANISFQTILHTLIGNVSTTDEMVIWNIRFPRNIVGALVGGNLAVSGAILQAVLHFWFSTLIKCRELFCGWLADSRQEAGLK